MEQQDYIKDITEIRAMMQRTSRFLSLSGWAGIMAGIYALVGAYTAYKVFGFNPDTVSYMVLKSEFLKVILLAIAVLVLSLGTAIYLSKRKAARRKEKIWNTTSRRLLVNMGVPLITGGLLILILISKGLTGLIIPVTLLLYGLSLYIAGKYTFEDLKGLGLLQVALGLLSAYFIEYSLILWALGFGLGHIVYGIYIHYKYGE